MTRERAAAVRESIFCGSSGSMTAGLVLKMYKRSGDVKAISKQEKRIEVDKKR